MKYNNMEESKNKTVYGYGDGTFTVKNGSHDVMCDKDGNIILKDGNHIIKNIKRKQGEAIKEWLSRNAVNSINGVSTQLTSKLGRHAKRIDYLSTYYSERPHLKIGSIFALANLDYMYEPFTHDRIHKHLSEADSKHVRVLYNEVVLLEGVNASENDSDKTLFETVKENNSKKHNK